VIKIYHIPFHIHNIASCSLSMIHILNLEEIERASRFTFEKDRCQFIFCRAILRRILGEQLSCNPKEIYFEYTSKGKPKLNTLYHKQNIHFNLSHTEGYALIAISKSIQVGIDVERERSIANLHSIIISTLSKQEANHVQSLPKNSQSEAFLHYWTKKEALLKGIGLGIDNALKEYDVGDWKEIQLSVRLSNQENEKWTILNIIPGLQKNKSFKYYDHVFYLNNLKHESLISNKNFMSSEYHNSVFSQYVGIQDREQIELQYIAAIAYKGEYIPITHYLIL